MSEKDINKLIAHKLSYYMNINDKSQQDLADYIGVTQATISNWCKGLKMPRMDKIDKICSFFNISRSDLMGSQDTDTFKYRKGVVINVLGRVAAGIPIEAVENIIDTEEISEELARTGEFFGLLIKGDSMTPGICDGDVVIVRKQENAESGDIVIATVNGTDAVCKRLRKYYEGIELISNNPSYKPMEFSNMDIEEKPVRIIGKVVELRRKF